MTALPGFMLSAAIRAVMLAGLTGAALFLSRPGSAILRLRVWRGVLVAGLLLPALHGWLPPLPVPVLPSLPAVTNVANRSAVAAPLPIPAAGLAAPQSTLRPVFVPHLDPITVLYGLIAAILLVRLLLGTLLAARVRRRAAIVAGLPVHVRVTAELHVPVTSGLLRPMILLPAAWNNWPSSRLNAVLRHEQDHVDRGDTRMLWLAELNCALFWFSPFSWWLRKKLEFLAEAVCDEAVLASGIAPREYAAALFAFFATLSRSSRRLDVAMARGDSEARIQSVLAWKGSVPMPRIDARTRWLIGAAAFAALYLTAAAQPAHRQHTQTSAAPATTTTESNFGDVVTVAVNAKEARLLFSGALPWVARSACFDSRQGMPAGARGICKLPPSAPATRLMATETAGGPQAVAVMPDALMKQCVDCPIPLSPTTWQGQVSVALRVGVDGTVLQAQVVAPDGLPTDITEPVAVHLWHWRFRPLTVNGAPSVAEATVKIDLVPPPPALSPELDVFGTTEVFPPLPLKSDINMYSGSLFDTLAAIPSAHVKWVAQAADRMPAGSIRTGIVFDLPAMAAENTTAPIDLAECYVNRNMRFGQEVALATTVTVQDFTSDKALLLRQLEAIRANQLAHSVSSQPLTREDRIGADLLLLANAERASQWEVVWAQELDCK